MTSEIIRLEIILDNVEELQQGLCSLIRHLKEDIHIFESSIRCHDLRKEG